VFPPQPHVVLWGNPLRSVTEDLHPYREKSWGARCLQPARFAMRWQAQKALAGQMAGA
jgi:hypothetical protein